MISDGFDLPPKWRDAAEQIARNMTTSIDPRDLVLPGGVSSEIGIERYAREYVAASGRSDLAVIYSIASVGICTATQGAWVLQVPLTGGGYLDIPAIQFACAIAPSGWRKSTALDAARKALLRSLLKGVRMRMDRVAEIRIRAQEQAARAMGEEEAGRRIDPKQFSQVYNPGICACTVVKDPTIEALGQLLAGNGGVATIMSAEAEMFRSMIAYNSDGGNLSTLLDGWSQEGMSTARVGRGLIEMGEVALNLIVLFQQEVFADVTGGASGRSDTFVTRGFFGRTLVSRATDVGGFEALAAKYGDDEEFDYHGPDGMVLPNGEYTPLGAALYDYQQAMDDLVEESNVYRLDKALHRAWEVALAEHGSDLQVPEPPLPQRYHLRLDRKALLAYRRVQRMQLAIESALADDRVDDDVRDVFTPLAARFTQHVMREALTVSLASGDGRHGGGRTVSAATIEDAATRLIPWRIAHTADALLTRASEVSEIAVRESTRANPKGDDLSTEGAVCRQLARMINKNPTRREAGFTGGEIRDRVRSSLVRPGSGGGGIAELVRKTLETLAANPESGVLRAPSSVDARGNSIVRYTMDLNMAARLL